MKVMVNGGVAPHMLLTSALAEGQQSVHAPAALFVAEEPHPQYTLYVGG
jgi:hypothetical protein